MREVVTVTVACVPCPLNPVTVISPADEIATDAGAVTETAHV